MTYPLIRFIFVLAVFWLVFRLRERAGKPVARTKRTAIITSLLFMLSFCAVAAVPFENAFYGFERVEDAYNYQDIGRVIHMIEEDDCALVISGDTSRRTYTTFTRGDRGWKLNSPYKLPRFELLKSSDFNYTAVVEYANKAACFVLVEDTFTPDVPIDQVEISDSVGSEFRVVTIGGRPTLYAFVKNAPSDYTIYIGGEPMR